MIETVRKLVAKHGIICLDCLSWQLMHMVKARMNRCQLNIEVRGALKSPLKIQAQARYAFLVAAFKVNCVRKKRLKYFSPYALTMLCSAIVRIAFATL